MGEARKISPRSQMASRKPKLSAFCRASLWADSEREAPSPSSSFSFSCVLPAAFIRDALPGIRFGARHVYKSRLIHGTVCVATG